MLFLLSAPSVLRARGEPPSAGERDLLGGRCRAGRQQRIALRTHEKGARECYASIVCRSSGSFRTRDLSIGRSSVVLVHINPTAFGHCSGPPQLCRSARGAGSASALVVRCRPPGLGRAPGMAAVRCAGARSRICGPPVCHTFPQLPTPADTPCAHVLQASRIAGLSRQRAVRVLAGALDCCAGSVSASSRSVMGRPRPLPPADHRDVPCPRSVHR